MNSLNMDSSAKSCERRDLAGGVGGLATIVGHPLELPRSTLEMARIGSDAVAPRRTTDELHCGLGGCMGLYRYFIGCPSPDALRPAELDGGVGGGIDFDRFAIQEE